MNESKLPSSTLTGFEGRVMTSRIVAGSELFTSVERMITSSFPFHATIAFCPDSSMRTDSGNEIMPLSAEHREVSNNRITRSLIAIFMIELQDSTPIKLFMTSIQTAVMKRHFKNGTNHISWILTMRRC